MQTLMRRRPLHYAISSVVAVAAIVSLASWQQIVADGAADTDGQLANGGELANEVEVTVPQTLRVAGKHTYSVKVTLTAKKEKSVSGPIFLVVQGTGIETLSAKQPDGLTADDEPYFLILPEGKKLSDAKPAVSQKIAFLSNGALRSKARREFQLDYRLTREISQRDRQSAGRNERRPRARRLAGVPGGRRGARSGRNSDNGRQQQNNDDDPASAENGDKAKKREPFALKPEITDKEVKRVTEIQDRWTKKLMAKEGVLGTGTAVNVDGDLVIRVYTTRSGINKNLPGTIEGIPVQAKVTGRFRPLYQPPQDKRGRAGTPGGPGTPGSLVPFPDPPEVTDPQMRFPRPVPIGVSGINQSAGCSTGTIGCRLKGADGSLYALSNNHVFADENSAPIGEPILQPGPLDDNCLVNANNSIGTLAAFVPIDFSLFAPNQVDAAVANVTAATLSNRTPQGAYGMPNSRTVQPRLGMKVQKMGRTTHYTTGRITAVNVTSLVGYAAGLGFFINQIEITKPILIIDDPTGNITINLEPFGGPGDSGSLIVTRHGNNPVGLLFAGSVFVIIANPIDVVLESVGNALGQAVTVDGGRSNAAP